MSHNTGLPLVSPASPPSLDPAFRPAVLANRAFRKAAQATGRAVPVAFALERSASSVSRFETMVAPPDSPTASGNLRYLERLLKFLLWSRGAGKVHFAGPLELGHQLQRHFEQTTTGRFDAEIMGMKIYDRPFEVAITTMAGLPAERETTAPLGRHWNGCRIGFDLGASDQKVAAVQDGKVVFSDEFPWDPRPQTDPQWHFDCIMRTLKEAAKHLPRVDAIGGSSAGVYVNNLVKVASLFRGVPEEQFKARIKNLFHDIQRAWGGIPVEVVNDGEVTALAGAMSLNQNAVLGVALGSSQAAGYVNREGQITSWLNELAFAPVDYSASAAVDEWSGDYGCGVQYFSQQGVSRLIPLSSLPVEAKLPLPEKLIVVQQAMAKGDERAARIYQSIGVYLGYTLAHYREFYDFSHLLLLGRVTTGEGGNLIVQRARKVLATEFPELAITIHMPDEKEKRHGQAMAAASLPVVP
ncbi:MAG TPA: ROK family protein [Verrucomicrobiae bacterium]|nr:ROK family protein [Verrucomicrobiae bacterium]